MMNIITWLENISQFIPIRSLVTAASNSFERFDKLKNHESCDWLNLTEPHVYQRGARGQRQHNIDVASLSGLPLVSHISSFIHPSAILDFALTCKQAHQCALKQLALNRDYQARFRASHDRQPLNVPSLLRRVLNDSNAAWYMRCFEFWGERSQWENWTSFDDYHVPEEEK